MIKENLSKLGPFPLGKDNKHKTSNKVFDQFGENTPRLTSATNFDIDDAGDLVRRTGVTLSRSGTGILGAWFENGRFFVQEGTNLIEKSGATENTRISSLARRVAMCSHANAIWVTDGTTHRVIRGNTVYNWGIPKPDITVTSSNTVSSLEAGRYLVRASYTDTYGNEGPVCAIKAITLAAGKSIQVTSTLSGFNEYLNIYASKVNQEELNFVAQVETLPHTFNTFPNDADFPPAEDCDGPISNAVGVFSFRSWIMMYKDNVVFRSESFEPHLFKYSTNIFQFDGTINTVVPLLNGFWVGTNNKLYWVADLPGLGADQDTSGWVPFEKYYGKIYPGGVVVNGSDIPSLQTTEKVALFISDNGLVVGKADGSYNLLTDGRYDFSTLTRSTIVYDGESSINKLLIGLVN